MEDKHKIIAKRTMIIKRQTNGGDKAKYYVEYASTATLNAVVLNKLILTNKRIRKQGFVIRLLKTYKGMFLYQQSISLTKDTYLGIAQALINSA